MLDNQKLPSVSEGTPVGSIVVTSPGLAMSTDCHVSMPFLPGLVCWKFYNYAILHAPHL